MFARFVKNVKFFEKSLIQKFLFLCNFKLFLHKINPKSHQPPLSNHSCGEWIRIENFADFSKNIVFAFS